MGADAAVFLSFFNGLTKEEEKCLKIETLKESLKDISGCKENKRTDWIAGERDMKTKGLKE